MLLFTMLLVLFIIIFVVSTLNFVQFNRYLDTCKKNIITPATMPSITKYDLDLLNKILGDGKGAKTRNG